METTKIKKNMTTLNPIKSKWAILTPKKGVARKEDRAFFEILNNGKRAKRILVFSTSKEKLLEKLNLAKGKLSKDYEVLIITDKQFGKLNNWNFDEIATKKQKSEIFILK